MSPKRLPKFTVHTEDERYWFKHGRKLKEREIREIFEERISAWTLDLFPGLVLEDEAGNKFTADLQVVLVPAEE